MSVQKTISNLVGPESYILPDGTHVRHSMYRIPQLQQQGFFHQYFLNPTLSINDGYIIIIALVLLSVLRIFLSGIRCRYSKNTPNILMYFVNKYNFVINGKQEKFCENAWYAVWHTTACAAGLYILWLEGGTEADPGWIRRHFRLPDGRWFWAITDSEAEFGSTGWPSIYPSAGIRYLYLIQAGFWISCILFLNFETRRSDFYIMWIHHVATLTLLLFSYACSYWKIGMLVLAFHDIVDVFLYIAKSLHYTKIHKFVVDIFFGGFVFSYLICRLICYPYYCVLPSINIDLFRELSSNVIQNRQEIPGAIGLPLFLVTLLVLHFYWFSCVIRMVICVFTTKESAKHGERSYNDIRSDDESSDSEDCKDR